MKHRRPRAARRGRRAADVLPARVQRYRPADLDALCAGGEVVWIGAGGVGADDGRIALAFRDQLRLVAPPPPEASPSGPIHDAIRAHLGARGASFWPELYDACAVGDERAILSALWDLVWAGEVTNDAWAPLRAGRRYGAPRARSQRRFSRRRDQATTATQGRWTITDRLFAERPVAKPRDAFPLPFIERLDSQVALCIECH